jgi:hypothetical protein
MRADDLMRDIAEGRVDDHLVDMLRAISKRLNKLLREAAGGRAGQTFKK